MRKYFAPGSENYVELLFVVICAYDIRSIKFYRIVFLCLKSTQYWTGGEGVDGGNPL